MKPFHPREKPEINLTKTEKKQLIPTLFLLLPALISCGCSSVFQQSVHYAHLDKDYLLRPGTQIEIGSVTNETEHDFDLDVEQMLTDALTKKLRKEGLLWEEGNSAKLTLDAQIIDYKKGSAFQRWLWPGWGKTDLIVHCNLKDENKTVGTLQAKGSVAWGGGFTIGAWRDIFDGVAKKVVRDLRKKLKSSSS